jgi:integrase
VDVDLPYLSAEKSRHGKARLYVRKNGRRILVKSPKGSPGFAREYAAAIEALDKLKTQPVKPLPSLPAPKSLGALAMQYFASSEFRGLDATMQKRRRSVIEECLREKLNDDAPEVFRDCPYAVMGPEHIRRLRDLKAAEIGKNGKEKAGAANNRRKYLSSMFGWAIEVGKARANPCREVRRVKYASEGFHTWTLAEVRKFTAKWPIWTKPRLALELLLLTGARRGDMVTLGRQHVEDGWIRYVPQKTRYKRMEPTYKPLLPQLAEVIAQSPCGDLTFLVTSFGKPFTPAGFSNWFRERCNEAGLPHCSAHGLRKAGATIAAESGATEQQLMAIFDWTTPAQAAVYTRKANRKKLAGGGMKLLASGSD